MGNTHKSIDEDQFVKSLIEILRGGNAMAMHFERLAKDLNVPEGTHTIVFLSGIKKILRELPDKAFPEPRQRLALVDAVQDALDTAIEAEEEALDAQPDDVQDEDQAASRGRTPVKPLAGGNR